MTERQLESLVHVRRCLFALLHSLHKFLATRFIKEPELLIYREEEATSVLQLTLAHYRTALDPAIPLLTKLTRDEPIFSCLGTAAPTAHELLAKRAQKTIPKLVLALKRLKNEAPEDERWLDDAKTIVADVPHSDRAWALLEAKLEKETHWLAESIAMSVTHGAAVEETLDARTTGSTRGPRIPTIPTIEVDTRLLQARYDSKFYRLTDAQATGLLALVDADGDWVSWSGLGITKPSEVKESLPNELKDLIETSPGKGYRLKRLP